MRYVKPCTDIRTVQELLGHIDVKATMTCAHVLNWNLTEGK